MYNCKATLRRISSAEKMKELIKVFNEQVFTRSLELDPYAGLSDFPTGFKPFDDESTKVYVQLISLIKGDENWKNFVVKHYDDNYNEICQAIEKKSDQECSAMIKSATIYFKVRTCGEVLEKLKKVEDRFDVYRFFVDNSIFDFYEKTPEYKEHKDVCDALMVISQIFSCEIKFALEALDVRKLK